MVVYNDFIPFKGYIAINLFGILFARSKYKPLDDVTIQHESIHSRQCLELLGIPFYILYLLEWAFRIVQFGDIHMAYRNISFEREAYDNERNNDYNRRWYGWIKYLKLQPN